MFRIPGIGVLTAVLVCLSPGVVHGQEPAAAPVQSEAALVAVMDFEYGATGRNWWAAEFVGKGIAELIAEKLAADGTYSVVERRWLAAIREEQKLGSSNDTSRPNPEAMPQVLGAKYLIVGSVTRFGDEKETQGVGSPIFLIGKRKGKAYVALTARLVDVKSSKVLASAQASGTSKREGVLVLSPAFFVGYTNFSSEYRDSILGEATELAVQQLVERLIAAAKVAP